MTRMRIVVKNCRAILRFPHQRANRRYLNSMRWPDLFDFASAAEFVDALVRGRPWLLTRMPP